MSEEKVDPRLSVQCRLCGAAPGMKCVNYKGRGKQTCAQRGTPEPAARTVVIADPTPAPLEVWNPPAASDGIGEGTLSQGIPDAVKIAQQRREEQGLSLRQKRIAAANVIRTNGGLVGRILGNVAVAYRVGGITPSEVQAVREELEASGVLADELDGQGAEQDRGELCQ